VADDDDLAGVAELSMNRALHCGKCDDKRCCNECFDPLSALASMTAPCASSANRQRAGDSGSVGTTSRSSPPAGI